MSQKHQKKIIEHLLYSGLGGHGSVFFSLVEADGQQEFDYRAVFCGIEPLRAEYESNCQRLGIPYSYINKKKGLDLPVYWKLFRNFRKNKPAVIFLHGVSFLMPAIWYKITSPSSTVIVRDTQAHHLKSKGEWFWLFFCLLFAKRIVLLTEASAEGIRKKFRWFIPKKRLKIIPNGLNIKKYQPRAEKPAGVPLRIGMQSRLQPIKDHPTLIRAFKQLREKLPAAELTLHIAGDGETMSAIKQLVAELGVADVVQLHGMLNETELLSFMHSLDIYVHATYGETQSNSIMQALACGLPVIASDVWGVNNMIHHGDNGLLYTSEKPDLLAAQLAVFVADPVKRKEFGTRARRFAEDHYSNEVMFARYKELYG